MWYQNLMPYKIKWFLKDKKVSKYMMSDYRKQKL